MCNLYSITRNQDAIRFFARALRDMAGNLPPLPGVYPDYRAPIVRNAPDGVRELAMARWGMPTPRSILEKSALARAEKLAAKGKPFDLDELKRNEPDSGVTNIRNPASPHWRRWLGPGSRCVVPFTSFSEPEILPSGARPPAWFALSEERPLAFFAGLWIPQWTSTRKVKEGPTTNDLFAFLTTEPNDVVGALHEKAMPVILTRQDEVEHWLTAPADEALKLQRPLPDGVLTIVARGTKEDG